MMMKKGSLNFLGRKNQSLFDTNVEIKDMGNLELVLESAAIPESGTAKVRSRPTVKHFMSSESLQGFAVPTPKVPVLPPFSEPKINGTGKPNGRMLSVPDIFEGEILIPPPPSSAPPPPPSTPAPPPPSFIPPLPQFFGAVDPSVDHASLQPPPMAPPKPPSLSGSRSSADSDLASLKPPPMAPPKPPSETSSMRGSLSSLEVQDIPDCPKFTPPPPPVVKTPPVVARAQKPAPPKPVRMSSIPNSESLAPTAPIATNPTPSSFNPQNTAKLYSIQKTTLLSEQSDRDKGVQSILLLDSTGNTVGVINGNNGKSPGVFQPVLSGVAPTKPARRNSSATQLQDDQPNITQAPPVKVEDRITPEPVITQSTPTEAPTPIKVSPRVERVPFVRQVKAPVESPGRSRRISPVLNHRQRNTQAAGGSAKKETTASPFALLMAAKEREKQRTTLSQQNSNPEEPVNTVIQPSVEKPNSFTVTPRDPQPDSPNTSFKSTTNMQPLTSPSATTEDPKVPHSKPELSSTLQQSSPMTSSVPDRDEEAFIPPPPEFANSDSEDEPPVPPPNHPAPAPPEKTAPQPGRTFIPLTPTVIMNSAPPNQPAPPPPKPSVPAPITNCSPPAPTPPPPPAPLNNCSAPKQPVPPPIKPSLPPTPPPVSNSPLIPPKPKPPKAPGPPPNLQPKPPVQSKPTQLQAPPSVSASQATLLSILQKKMLEMDNKISAVKIVESNGDDWNSPLSDDEPTSPPAISIPTKNRSATPSAQPQSLDMKELESKAAKKAQDLATSSKSQNSNSKQPYGMTFTVRPGSKQPITPVIKDGAP